jgi:hypothetical protein
MRPIINSTFVWVGRPTPALWDQATLLRWRTPPASSRATGGRTCSTKSTALPKEASDRAAERDQ